MKFEPGGGAGDAIVPSNTVMFWVYFIWVENWFRQAQPAPVDTPQGYVETN